MQQLIHLTTDTSINEFYIYGLNLCFFVDVGVCWM